MKFPLGVQSWPGENRVGLRVYDGRAELTDEWLNRFENPLIGMVAVRTMIGQDSTQIGRAVNTSPGQVRNYLSSVYKGLDTSGQDAIFPRCLELGAMKITSSLTHTLHLTEREIDALGQAVELDKILRTERTASPSRLSASAQNLIKRAGIRTRIPRTGLITALYLNGRFTVPRRSTDTPD